MAVGDASVEGCGTAAGEQASTHALPARVIALSTRALSAIGSLGPSRLEGAEARVGASPRRSRDYGELRATIPSSGKPVTASVGIKPSQASACGVMNTLV